MTRQIVVAVAALLALAVLSACGGGGGDEPEPVTDYPYEIETFADLGRTHFAAGQVYDNYNSNPPTSGPHAGVFEQWGIFEQPVPKEIAVHNMEHSGVIVWYNCAGGPEPLSDEECSQLKNDLASVVQPAIAGGEMIIMTPYSSMTDQIALTAWQHLDRFNEFDRERVQTFIDTFECRFDPEGFC